MTVRATNAGSPTSHTEKPKQDVMLVMEVVCSDLCSIQRLANK